MLVALEGNVQHLASLIALLVHQLVAYYQQPGEGGLDDLVEVRPAVAVARLEAICPADGQKTLQPSQNRSWIVGVEQLEGVVHKVRPSLGKVEVQDTLQDWNELVSHQVLRAGEDGQ
jgi:hypothetical protein